MADPSVTYSVYTHLMLLAPGGDNHAMGERAERSLACFGPLGHLPQLSHPLWKDQKELGS